MNLKVAKQTLFELRQASNQTMAIKVATRWLIADIATEYDILLRLQILEGVLGVAVNSLARKSKLGLSAAAKQLEGSKIKPEWLAPSNTGMYKAVENALEVEIKKHNVTEFNAGDLINEAASGLGISGDVVEKHKLHEIGSHFKNDILEGRVTPKAMGLGPLMLFLKRALDTKQKATHEFKFEKNPETGKMERKVTRIRETEDYDPVGRAETPQKMETDLVELIEDRHNTLGKKIRDFMRKVWRSTKDHEFMETWLNLLEEGSPVNSIRELGRRFDFSAQTAVNTWERGWKAFFQAFWKNNALIQDIEDYFLKQGLIWDANKIKSRIPQALKTAYLNPKFFR